MNPTAYASAPDLPGFELYEQSQALSGEARFFLASRDDRRCLLLLAPPGNLLLERFTGERALRDDVELLIGPADHANAAALRDALPWLRPRPLGLRTSAGMGDRLGLATPGHVRAVQRTGEIPGGRAIAPIFAQQSIREMARTGRTPGEVLDDATWGVFQEGWRGDQGADADHLKTAADADRCASAGFTFFTIDPGEHVAGSAGALDEAALRAGFAALPWTELDSSPEGMFGRFRGRRFDLDDRRIELDEATLLRAAVKYGRAVAHVAGIYRRLVATLPAGGFELEVSVDETETPTSHAEHLIVALELARLGVRWVSLAPRFVGRFDKGVDYAGDLAAFERDFAGHAAVARCLGPYKLSLHSGSDKFSIYGIAAEHARGLLHLKTAGTSYLEALRTLAQVAPDLFRRIYDVAVQCYETDRASYHVSAALGSVPPSSSLRDADLPACLDEFDARQVLHVTYGSVLAPERGLRAPLFDALRHHAGAYASNLERHLARHLAPLAGQ
jgi:tagaturonate epimerase